MRVCVLVACAGLVPGALQLHYADTPPECLSSLALPPSQLLQIMESNAAWQQQPVLSDADITAEAMRLGLLPVRSPRAAGERIAAASAHQIIGGIAAQTYWVSRY